MKRFTLIVALVLMVAMPTFAERVTSETAQKVATTFLNNNGAKSAQLTDLSKEAGFPNLYIFNAEQGFVVMSADDCVQPILGYSLTGYFTTEDMPENVRGWLQGYNDEIQFAIENQQKATPETAKLWKELTNGNSKVAKATTVVNPLIQTKWDQNKYYNNLCPAVSDGPEGHAYTGCVATAMAQIMKYHNYPTRGIGSHSYTWNNQTLSADFGATTYDWDNMQLYYNYYFVNGTDTYPNWLDAPTSEQIAAVATLMYHCGVSVDMVYGGNSTGGSASSLQDVATALKAYFNYSPEIEYKEKKDYDDNTWINMLKAELDANRPLGYRGSGSGGHAFVCDGYNNSNYFHFNWGWSGAYNGYFSLSNLNTGANNQSGQGNGVYTDNQAAIFGIMPSSNNATPTNLTYTLSGLQNITLNWTGATGAASYNIYCNGNLVGNTTSTTYAHTAPFGTDIYYVRSVNAAGELSLASNQVTVTISYQQPIVDDLSATLSGNNVSLSWTAPDWCYPETPSATLTYGTQTNSGTYFPWGTNSRYWGHRHLAENISAYNGLRLYDVDFYVNDPGNYELCIFEGTTTSNGYTIPLNQVYSQSVSALNSGWNTINLNNPYFINGVQDLWVFIHNTEIFDNLQVYLCQAEGNEGVYYSANPTSYTYNNATGYAFLIKAFLTDGTYTYNLYRNNDMVAGNLSNTTYTTQLLSNSPNLYYVKTNYYGGETETSNKVGFAKGNASLATLALDAADQMTVTENSKLTVSGALSSSNAANLILENGAQLIHNSANAQATVKKDIAAYTNNNNNWNLIASPVTEDLTPNTDNGLLGGTYDLYYYAEPNFLWMNYKDAAFDLAHQQGYLYANNASTTLQFAGTLTPSNSSVTLSDLSHSATVLNGFNLVGNPFACNATVDKSFYVTDETGSNIILAGSDRQVKPCEGIFVQATDGNTSVTFTKAGAKSRSLSGSFDLTLTQGHISLDRARVQLEVEESLDKFGLNDNTSSQIYFTQNGRNFAVTSISGEHELPLNFKAAKNGTYALSIEAEELGLDYLHLIDNLTGNDVDLLSTPNYTFEAKTSDYASRFRLVFDAIDADTNDSFVYVANGNLHVINQGEAELQIIDVMGRILHNETITGSFDMPLNLVAGTYILHLSNASQVLTQKIVIQ